MRNKIDKGNRILLSYIISYIKFPTKNAIVYYISVCSSSQENKVCLLRENAASGSPFLGIVLGFPKDCGSDIDQVETGAWNDVVDLKNNMVKRS